jgi:hypothetical protein
MDVNMGCDATFEVPAGTRFESTDHKGQVANGGIRLEAHGALRGDLRLRDELVPG